MEKLLIRGGNSLSGEIRCSVAKNAALPMIAATILTENEVILKNLPFLQDITTMFELLGSMGSKITLDEEMNFQISSSLSDFEARYELVKTMRASILVLGPLLAKYGEAKIALPGGCGTLDELIEVITFKRLGLFTKPIIILNVAGFYDPFKEMLEKCVDEKFMDDKHLDMWQFVDDYQDVIPSIKNAKPWNSDALNFARKE